ncbi:MAG: RIP metalloprotease RseP [Treponema sp.]|nr:RIP metalloprotease RseP [Treponema sp.]
MIVVYGLIVLGIIVFIHEMGHFWVAKACGVQVEAFSVGMGPVLLHREWKRTDWRLSLVPLGGYCAMKGEQDFMKAADESLDTIDAEPDSLYGIKPILRAAIGAAGPFANLLFAVIAYTLVAIFGYTYYSAGNQIQLANEVYPEVESAAAKAGLLTGDKILAINGTEIENFSDIYGFVALHPEEDLQVTVERNGNLLDFTVHTAMAENGAGKIGVVSIPDTVQKYEAKRYTFFPAIWQGVKETGTNIALTVKGISLLFRGAKVTESVSGPARITTMLGSTVKDGFSAGFRTGLSSVLQFMALISISLFIMNLLPIPILDGGLILFSVIEAIFGITISPKWRIRVQYIGLAFIAFLFVVAMAGDIHYFIGLFHEK